MSTVEPLDQTPSDDAAPAAQDVVRPAEQSIDPPARTFWAPVPAGFAASLLCHGLLVLWGIGIFEGAKPLAAVPPESITVDLVSREEAGDRPNQDATSEASSQPTPQPAPDKPAAPEMPAFNAGAYPLRPTLPETQARRAPRPDVPNPSLVPDSESSADDPDPSLSLAARLTATLQLPVVMPDSEGDTRPAETRIKLEKSAIADFKARLNRCWTPPAPTADSARLKLLIRVVLKRDGTFQREPTLIQAPASASGPALMRSAMQALQQCLPYDFLPASKYDEWKVMDLAFSPQGIL